ncbi:sugar ABC transporter permease [Paenibacillus sp. FSL R10-2734]|uniref:carbohydrate ABC transporter permease n=1 Tax=Paenibacillus sp. FSL R10-2734 TaxID=2954691 RepID=UPI0030D88EFD
MKIRKSIIALFILPAVCIYLAIFLYPTLRSLAMSFFNIPTLSSKLKDWSFVGFENYTSLFQNSYFMDSAKNVLVIWIVGGLITFFFAFLYAVILSSGVKGKTFFRSIIFLPNTVSAVVLSIVWLHYIYNSDYGFLTTFFRTIGLDYLANIQWTEDGHIFMAMLIAYCFSSIGYYLLILNAGMDRIPHDYYEAANLEGANAFYKFFRITLPLVKDVLRTTIILWTIGAINFFVWSATFGSGGLQSSKTATPGYYMYLKVFGAERTVYQVEDFNIGSGATVGVLITLAILILSYIINLFFRKERLEY